MLGTICGMGGGIIIKPVLDSTGVMTVSTITFLSGCTVIAMSCWNVSKTMMQKETVIDLKNTSILAVGAAIGGLFGKTTFSFVASLFPNPDTAGGIQAVVLFLATLATFIYTIKKEQITAKKISNVFLIFFIGAVLGFLGSFLGIGGGPFNVAVLYYFFSMQTKQATQNSLYIILFSQLAGTIKTVVSSGIPDFSWMILLGMMVFSILGSEFGRKLNKKLNEQQATYCLEGAMVFIMLINLYNSYHFFH